MQKNILFVVIDQLRADCLFGRLADSAQLKNLRALAEEGVTFLNHFSVTSPCGPSRASLLTGQYAMNHRSIRNGTPLPHDKPNLATEVRKSGYLPLLFGYTDTTLDPRVYAADDPALKSYEQVMPGFVEIQEMRLEESWAWRAHLIDKGYQVPPFPEIYRPDGPNPDDPAFYKAEDSDTAFLTDRVIKELSARQQGWFAHVTYIRPHPPLVAPSPYNKVVDAAKIPQALPPDADSEHPFFVSTKAIKPISGNVEGFPNLEPTEENVAIMRSLYLGLAKEVDDHIGRLVEFLKSSGQYDNTAIIVTADHGEMLGDHGLWDKMAYHDPAFHVPLIVIDPTAVEAKGTRVEAFTESVDVTPTILELVGRTAPDTMDGRSLVPFLADDTPEDWRQHSFSELDFGNPVSPSPWQTHMKVDADSANLAILRTHDHTLVHFNGGLPQITFSKNGASSSKKVSTGSIHDAVKLELYQSMLNHRMSHAGGRFSRTMITKEGAVRG